MGAQLIYNYNGFLFTNIWHGLFVLCFPMLSPCFWPTFFIFCSNNRKEPTS